MRLQLLLRFPCRIFILLLQRSPREWEARLLLFTIQRTGKQIFFPRFLAHYVSTLDTGSPILLCGWDATTATTNQQLNKQTFDEYTLGGCRDIWLDFFGTHSSIAIREWVFSPSTDPQESREKLKKQWNYWETHVSGLLNTLSVPKGVPHLKM